ncbi:MAG: type VII secretion-associated protein [Gordonia sp. (in: high G+C Gram-positive bacteria)]
MSSAIGPAPAVTRPPVIDLAYGENVGIGAWPPGTAPITMVSVLEAIDAPTVSVAGEVRFTHEVIRDMIAAEIANSGVSNDDPIVVGYPSTWGSTRRDVLARACAGLPAAIMLTPRAMLIARSHSDAVMARCAVVETTHLPSYPVDPAHPSGPTWDVLRLSRSGDGWVIDRCGLLDPDDPDIDVAVRVQELIDDSVEAVFVDGADPVMLARAIDLVSADVVAGRVVATDHALIRRYGARRGSLEPMPHTSVSEPITVVAAVRARRRWLWMGAAAAMVSLLAAAAVAFSGRGGETTPAQVSISVARTTMSIPRGWRRSSPPEPNAAAHDDATSRTVFTDPGTGGRILLVQSRVRSGSTPASVAASLANRIRQRGDDVVTEFSPTTRFGGRDVISYREAPESGSAIDWYVLVDDDLQVSIGCQPGTGGQPIDDQCVTAVSSARIAPR